jgi:hypothetical protein
MKHPQLSHRVPLYRNLGVLLLFLLIVVGCPKSTGPVTDTGPPLHLIPGTGASASLAKAQNIFNDAVRSDQPEVNVPAASLQKYQEVVNILETEVIGKATKPLEVNAYALLAFSQWRLNDCGKAMEAGDKGRRIYEAEKLSTNRRDYGMCLMVGGLCLSSQAYKEFQNLQVSPTKEMAQDLTGRLQQAMQSIDSVNSQLDRREDIAIYANLWQLALVYAAVRIWTSGPPREVSTPEVCRWLERGEQVLTKIPEAGNPWQNLATDYKNKFEQLKKARCQGR